MISYNKKRIRKAKITNPQKNQNNEIYLDHLNLKSENIL